MFKRREHALITSENHRATGVKPLKFQDDMLILSTGNSMFVHWNDAKWAASAMLQNRRLLFGEAH